MGSVDMLMDRVLISRENTSPLKEYKSAAAITTVTKYTR